ncbi:M6 family metalloprotease domain-containing protein [bacterium]|nr:M6 family metalloprotease domain-containing protein [bacterium]
MTGSMKSVAIALLTVLILGTAAMAMPPSPALVEAIQQQQMDEPYFLQHREALYARGVNSPTQVEMRQGELDETIFNSIVILVDFNDHQAVTAGSFFDDLMYGTGTGTVADYYDECSYGDFVLTTEDMPSAQGWYRMPQNYGYYVDGQNGFGDYPNNAQGLAEAAVLAADPYVDFSDYDYDNDGYVDGLFIMHAGTGAELSGNDNDIWSHKWQIPGGVSVDGVTASVYAMQPEFWYSSGDMTIGVVAHEMGHAVFGLPDLYDYGYDSAGLDNWSLMAGGSWNGGLGSSPAHPDAWSRTYMGFVDPINVTFDRIGESIPNVETEPVIYRLWTEGMGGNEYFLVENRYRTGYDSPLPSQGLLIYHCDDSEWGNNNQWYPGHTNDGHYQVALEQADGLWELEQNGSADSGDPYPGSTLNFTFNGSSTPDSDNYWGSATQVAVTNISYAGATMTADFAVGLGSGTPDFSVNIEPQSSPVTIPANGGWLHYAALLDNELSSPMVANVWVEATLPNNNVFHVDTYTVNFQPSAPLYFPNINQRIPAMAPAGEYAFRVVIGQYPSEVYASDEFPFTKLGSAATGEMDRTAWTSEGWEAALAEMESGIALPTQFTVGEAYPNPFNAQSSVEIALPDAANLQVALYNVLGQQVMTLTDARYSAGTHRLTIDARDLTSGLYFLRATVNGMTETRKLVLMK